MLIQLNYHFASEAVVEFYFIFPLKKEKWKRGKVTIFALPFRVKEFDSFTDTHFLAV